MAGKPSLQWYPGDWFKAEEVRSCSPATRGIWFDFINYAFNSQSYGAVKGTIPSLARRCGSTIEEMQHALEEIELNNVGEVLRASNGVVTVVCRRLRREQEEREGNAEYMREYRARKREEEDEEGGAVPSCNGNVSDRKSDVSTLKGSCTSRTRAEEEVEDEVEVDKPTKVNTSNRAREASWTKRDVRAIYDLYPRKVGKETALSKIDRALRRISNRSDPPDDPVDWLSERVKRFAKSPKGQAGKYCPYPATWFHQGRYDDDPSEWSRDDEEESKAITSIDNFK